MPHQFYVWSNYAVDLLGTFGYVCGKLPLSYFWTRRERILVSLGVKKTSHHNQYNLTDRSQWRLYRIALGQPQWVPYKQGFLGDLVTLRGHKHCRWFEHISHIHRTKRWQKKTATLPSKNEGFPNFQARPTGRDQIWTHSCWMLGGSKRLMRKRLSRKLRQQSGWKHQSPMGLTPSETTVIETNHVIARCLFQVKSWQYLHAASKKIKQGTTVSALPSMLITSCSCRAMF